MLSRPATQADWPQIEALLQAANLPLEGAQDHLKTFRVMEVSGQLWGVAGLEIHADTGLLRSVATDPEHRSQGVAAGLVADLIQEHPRSCTPPALQASPEFQGVCPTSATFMTLSLTQEFTMPQTQSIPVPGLSDQSSTLAFLGDLRAQPQRPLEFHLHGEPLVPAGYHVTEVKAVTIEAMDCGGKANAWRETVIQLMDGSAEEAKAGFMTNRKFLAIYDRVVRHIPVRDEAEVRFEYGNSVTPAMQYHVTQVEAQAERVIVHLRTPGVQCKAGDACGLPSEASSEVGCAPESGCCSPAPVQLMTLG